jgi:hypothetical protein
MEQWIKPLLTHTLTEVQPPIITMAIIPTLQATITGRIVSPTRSKMVCSATGILGNRKISMVRSTAARK